MAWEWSEKLDRLNPLGLWWPLGESPTQGCWFGFGSVTFHGGPVWLLPPAPVSGPRKWAQEEGSRTRPSGMEQPINKSLRLL